MLGPKFCLIWFVSYAIGSIPFGYMLVRNIKQISVLSVGSGNIGARNVARVLGNRWGFATFLMDAMKGVAAVVIAHLALFEYKNSQAFLYSAPLMAAGFLSVIGHDWPAFLKFRGGKGLSTTIGALLALGLFLPELRIPSLIGLGTSAIAFFVSKSMFISASLALLIYFMTCLFDPYISIQHKMILFCFGLLLLIKHTDNFREIFQKYHGEA